MNRTPARRADDRSRAVRRLQTLTLGTVIAGAAATAGLGWVAAATYDGTETAVADAGTSAAVTDAGTSTTDDSSTSISSSTPVTGSSGAAQVSTGGS